jgi:polyisoprenoid-binding protein YceI
MSAPSTPNTTPVTADLAGTAWRIDPARSRVEFRVRHFWGLMTVTGHFTRFDGGLDMNAVPAISLEIDAASVDTGNAKRDTHLRSADFFDAGQHPSISFASEEVTVRGNRLEVTGVLHAAGNGLRLVFGADLGADGDDLTVDVTTTADQRALGMTWSPMGIMKSPTTMVIHAHLVRERRDRN